MGIEQSPISSSAKITSFAGVVTTEVVVGGLVVVVVGRAAVVVVCSAAAAVVGAAAVVVVVAVWEAQEPRVTRSRLARIADGVRARIIFI